MKFTRELVITLVFYAVHVMSMSIPPGKNLFRPKKVVAQSFLDLMQKELNLKGRNEKSVDKRTDLEAQKLELRILAELILDDQMREAVVKRTCVDWWCFGDRATDTTAPPPTTLSTTIPPTTQAPANSAADEYQRLLELLKQLFGSGLFG